MACQPTETRACTKTKQEMLDYLGPLDFVVVYRDATLATRNFDEPIDRSLKITNQQIDHEKPNFIHSKLQQSTLEDDVNFFMQGIEIEYGFW